MVLQRPRGRKADQVHGLLRKRPPPRASRGARDEAYTRREPTEEPRLTAPRFCGCLSGEGRNRTADLGIMSLGFTNETRAKYAKGEWGTLPAASRFAPVVGYRWGTASERPARPFPAW
jgi:hypothetical protein